MAHLNKGLMLFMVTQLVRMALKQLKSIWLELLGFEVPLAVSDRFTTIQEMVRVLSSNGNGYLKI